MFENAQNEKLGNAPKNDFVPEKYPTPLLC
jgi:hypothetical protein